MMFRISDRMAAYYRDTMTLPPTIVRQGERVENHALFEAGGHPDGLIDRTV